MKPKKFIHMRRKVILFLAIFIVFCLATVWLSQTLFLRTFYRSLRISRTKEIIEKISILLEEINPEDDIGSLAEDEQTCVSIYFVSPNSDNESGVTTSPYLQFHTRNVCILHNALLETTIDDLYEGAKNQDTYMTEVNPAPRNDPPDASFLSPKEGFATTLLCSKLASVDGTEYLIITNSEITPMDSTVSTLRMLLLVLTLVMVLGGIILVLLIPRLITKSLEKMSRQAKELATGNFDVHFDGGQIKETAELADALNYAASEMSKITQMQRELLANISHDLRTPLTMISGYSEVMRDIPGEMNPENMQVIIDETARLTSLVNDTLDLARLSSEKQNLHLSVFSLSDALREAIHRYNTLMEREGYIIDLQINEDILVCADQTRILQVIYNLINNALSYTGEDKRVIVRQTLENSIVRISVTDSGPGIPEDQLSNIWERYYKLNEYHRRGVSGTGLGLSICKQILLQHNASFGVSSKLGQGSTFWFELSQFKNESSGY